MEGLCYCGQEIDESEIIIDKENGDWGCVNCCKLCDDCGHILYFDEVGEYCPHCGCHL